MDISYGIQERYSILSVGRLRKFATTLEKRITAWEIIAIALGFHLFAIFFPNDAVVFDETYYTKAGLDILQGVASNPEHPFLGKLWGSIGIALLGNSALGWRIHSVLFGLLTMIYFYKLARIFLSERHASYATALLAFENIFFVHTSLYLLEGPALALAIVALYCYFKKRYLVSALALGLSILSKETSLFFLLLIGSYHFYKRAPDLLHRRTSIKPATAKALMFAGVLVATIMVPMAVYDALYEPPATVTLVATPTLLVDEKGNFVGMTTSTRTVMSNPMTNPAQHWYYIATYASQLTIKPGDKADQNNYAWNWVLPLVPKEIVYYGLDISKAVNTVEDGKVVSSTVTGFTQIKWVGLGTQPIWVVGFWMVTGYTMFYTFTKRNLTFEPLILLWIAWTYGPYLLLSLVLKRIVYPFYFINTVPAIALGMPLVLVWLGGRLKSWTFFLYLASVLFWFALYFPVKILNLWV